MNKREIAINKLIDKYQQRLKVYDDFFVNDNNDDASFHKNNIQIDIIENMLNRTNCKFCIVDYYKPQINENVPF